ncbi:MAG: hypothetical protein ACP5U1_11080 [Desulfomonilaceae bacterium]
MMKNHALSICIVCLICLGLVASCQETKTLTSVQSHPELIGTWVLTSRVENGAVVPAKDRLVKIQLKEDGTFQISYRGEPQQQWIQAGHGAYLYSPPTLSLHWDSGRIVPLLVSNLNSEGFHAHHGRVLAPLKDQEPDEIFKKVLKKKGPTSEGS